MSLDIHLAAQLDRLGRDHRDLEDDPDRPRDMAIAEQLESR